MSRYRELAPLATGLLMMQRAKDAGDDAAYRNAVTQFKTEMEGLKGVMDLQTSRQALDIAGAQESFRQQQRPVELRQAEADVTATITQTTAEQSELLASEQNRDRLRRYEEAFKKVSGKDLEQFEAEERLAIGQQVVSEAGLAAGRAAGLTEVEEPTLAAKREKVELEAEIETIPIVGEKVRQEAELAKRKAEELIKVKAPAREAEAVIAKFGLQIAKDELEQTKVTALTEAGYGAIEADILVKILKKQPDKMDAEIELLVAQAGKLRGELVADDTMRAEAERRGIDYDAMLFDAEQAKRGIPHAQQIAITEKALADLRSGTVTLAQVMARAYDAGLDTGVNPTDKVKAIAQLEKHLKRQKQLFKLATGIVWDSLGATFREGSMAQLREVGGGIQEQATPRPAPAAPLDDTVRKQNVEQLRKIRQGL